MTDTVAPPRWTEYMPVADLAPALRNAKAHDLQALAASVDAFGLMEPVVLDERTGRLVSGHGRVEHLAALEKLGDELPDGATIDAEGRWCWLVTRGWRSRDDDHAHAAGIALNRVGERGGWHETELVPLLDDLVGSPFFDASGFTADDLDDLIAAASAASDAGSSSAWATSTPAEDADRYRASAVRAVILNFPVEDYPTIIELLGTMRRRLGVDTNSAVVERMLRDACADD